MRIPRLLGCLAAGALLGLPACGDDDVTIAETGTTQPPETTTTLEPTTTTEAASGTVTELEITAADYSFSTGGTLSVPAGALRMTLENASTAEAHQATLLRLNDGVTLRDLVAAGASDPTGRAALALVEGFGGPNGVGPGQTAVASAVVEDGQYALICFLPSPSDGVPHLAKGMALPLEVTAAEQDEPARLEAEETITARDYTWEVPADFDGDGTYRFENDGPQPHELAVYRIADGSTVADVQASLASPTPTGPPPFAPAGAGIALVGPGAETALEFALDPGAYAFVCFIPDSGTGVPHFSLGMILGVEVT